MVFSSLYFLYLFLPLTLLIYHLVKPIKIKNIVLLAASLYFYAWGEPKYIFLMIAVTLLDWVAGIFIEVTRKQKACKIILIAAVSLNLLSLFIFKYLNLFTGTLGKLFSMQATQLALPIGISFYTFQALSYLVDVYRGQVRCQTNPLHLLLYISMFPQLIAGPIVRYSDIAAEISKRRVNFADFSDGITRFVIGLSKKVILANYLGEITATYLADDAASPTVFGMWMGLIAYFFQIYFDFSGYSDMAIGMGRMLGFHFNENFKYPYTAVSVTDFWRKWHISLSSFFRDYVYIPLGGNRKHHVRNLLIVWALTGFWHGASWNFVLWGLYYFGLLMGEKYGYGKKLEKLPRIVGHIYSCFAVLIGWVFFYFDHFGSMLRAFGRLIGIGCTGFINSGDGVYFKNHLFLFLIAIIACMPLCSRLSGNVRRLSGKSTGGVIAYGTATIVFQVTLLLISTFCLVSATYNPFLYFRF